MRRGSPGAAVSSHPRAFFLFPFPPTHNLNGDFRGGMNKRKKRRKKGSERINTKAPSPTTIGRDCAKEAQKREKREEKNQGKHTRRRRRGKTSGPLGTTNVLAAPARGGKDTARSSACVSTEAARDKEKKQGPRSTNKEPQVEKLPKHIKRECVPDAPDRGRGVCCCTTNTERLGEGRAGKAGVFSIEHAFWRNRQVFGGRGGAELPKVRRGADPRHTCQKERQYTIFNLQV